MTSDKNTAENILRNLKSLVGNKTALYSGLFVTFMGGSVDDLLVQIQKAREIGINGVILFDYAHFSSKYVDALSTRVFNRNFDEHHKSQTVQKRSTPKTAIYTNDKPKKKKRFFGRNKD